MTDSPEPTPRILKPGAEEGEHFHLEGDAGYGPEGFPHGLKNESAAPAQVLLIFGTPTVDRSSAVYTPQGG